jgi:hypothetical protein
MTSTSLLPAASASSLDSSVPHQRAAPSRINPKLAAVQHRREDQHMNMKNI